MHSENNAVKKEIVDTVKQFNPSGLSVSTSGNVSVRVKDGFIITPTGVEYNELNSDDLVTCDNNGKVVQGSLGPSSEWPFHKALYQAYPEINAIVHLHSPYATGLSCTRKSIPPFHYMVAVAGGDSIRCAEYATFGSDQLSKNIVTALTDRKACLLANHGMVAVGGTLTTTFKLAQEVEALAKWYCISIQVGGTVLLNEHEMEEIKNKIHHYGKQNINN